MNDTPVFLERVAGFLLQLKPSEGAETLVVFPNKRSQLFLKQAILRAAEKDFWLPQMMTIDDLMVQLSGVSVVDPLLAYFELYQIHLEQEKEQVRTLDEFFSWAPLMLNDFSDIDYSLADAYRLFHELSEAKVLEEWNLGERPLTEMQKDYLSFFHSLYAYYETLQMRLLKKNAAYKAMAYRLAAEKVKDEKELFFQWKRFVFVGFNALTEAEKRVTAALSEKAELHYFIHADHFYFSPEKKTYHEAGRFLREMVRYLKISNPLWVDNRLLTTEKEVKIYGVPGQTRQVKLAGQILSEWLEEGTPDEKTAIILADEHLLIPLLDSVPSSVYNQPVHYNVTMGYSLEYSPFYDLVYRWLKLFQVQKNGQSQEIRVLSEDLEILMQNPLVQMLTGKQLADFYPVQSVYAPVSSVLAAADDERLKTFLGNLFSVGKDPSVFPSRLKIFLQALKQLPVFSAPENRLLQNQLILVMQVVKLVENLFQGQSHIPDFEGLQKIFLQLLRRREVSLKGEPLKGIQVMGILETRNLDFDRIIVLGANEGILPKNGFHESFIPYDLRRAHRLPLQNSEASVMSYYFFRLLQHARQAVFVYNSEPDVLGGGEMSRFLLQLENEIAEKNPRFRLQKKMVYVPLPDVTLHAETEIQKTALVRERMDMLMANGLSPSALNVYIRCPLQFYYRHVAQIRLPDEPQVSIQSDVFGSVLHSVLETLYRPFLGQPVRPDELLRYFLKDPDKLLQEKFLEIYGPRDLSNGRDLLIYHVAKRYLERFIKNDVKALEKEPRVLEGLEQKVFARLSVKDKTVKLKGVMDRVDRKTGEAVYRIIDYKTGKTEPRYLKPASWDVLLENTDYSKAFQVLVYSWLFLKQDGSDKKVQPGIISLRRADGAFLPVSFPEDASQKEMMEQTENLLSELIGEILDETIPFCQTENPKVCEYCDYKGLCNRK
ncbi:PD-(D/E)XK nuclease family protein [Candidatus Sulfidibacterium hydrothermale]|uniref:PD-(D/E)XK nuclease family protein n=1 Tax=Candidatus Sulfidibacterium hydrothermale TaxID=2875962 RepID=UPI001F0AA69D|nr:PD-(D/E)XK nuclease family protein [Candidatus Sulfidibacterium hydrothermale]UBM61633.1 PD-(D/E)XK nuclease family protein [Candidatus Sulfidibacterium hydrothermale]